MREFADLHLRLRNAGDAEDMVSLAHAFGFKTVALTVSRKTLAEIQNPGLNLLSRLDVDASSQRELNESLKGKSSDIVAVRCLTKDVARRAARDPRVDLLAFPEEPTRRREVWLDRHEAEVAEGSGVAYEVNASELIAAGAGKLPKLLAQVRRELSNAERHGIPVVMSSGAADSLAMREPRAFAALAELLDIDEEDALGMISTVPAELVARRFAKRGGKNGDAG